LTLIGVPTDAALTAGLETGTISGTYGLGISTLSQLESNPNVSVYQGAPFATAAEVISATKGPLANPTVRQAVSLAIDRNGLINTLLRGAGSVPHALAASGTWGYAKDVFSQAYNQLPAINQDLTKAQNLIKQAGVAGQTVTIGTSSGITAVNTEALAFKSACEAVGLKVVLQNVSPSNYINYFTDPKAFGSVDAFATTNYGDYADPAALYATLALPGGSQNFNSWSNPDVTKDLDASRGESDPTKRAQDVAAAQKIITDQLPWIPLAAPNTVLVMNKKITGAPSTFQYMFGPWAAYLGGS
jgi:peptide/nickel transport system substrate-binding protein